LGQIELQHATTTSATDESITILINLTRSQQVGWDRSAYGWGHRNSKKREKKRLQDAQCHQYAMASLFLRQNLALSYIYLN